MFSVPSNFFRPTLFLRKVGQYSPPQTDFNAYQEDIMVKKIKSLAAP